MTPESLLRAMFDEAVAVADPMRSLASYLPPKPPGRVVVIGAGKASARMAEAVEAEWGPCEGLVITRYGYARPCKGIEIVEAAHPVPDAAGVAATARMLELLATCGPEDFVLALISGGGSALLIQPGGRDHAGRETGADAGAARLGRADRGDQRHPQGNLGGQGRAAGRRGLPGADAGAAHFRCARRRPGRYRQRPDRGAFRRCGAGAGGAARWGVDPPPSIRAFLEAGGDPGASRRPEARPGRERHRRGPVAVARRRRRLAEAQGYAVDVLGDAIEGEAREVARDHAARALAAKGPRVILSGGELTVTRRGDGIGGPNAEYALALAIALDGARDIHAIACDTDGVDGAAEVAGALIGPDTLAQARRPGSTPNHGAGQNDAHGFFAAIGGQVVTGPTLTNVNDFRAILIAPRPERPRPCLSTPSCSTPPRPRRGPHPRGLRDPRRAELPGMSGFRHGPNRDFEGKSARYTYGFMVLFENRDVHLAYEAHPDHVRAGGIMVENSRGGHDGIFVSDLEV
jgi:glycerate 2-kinase